MLSSHRILTKMQKLFQDGGQTHDLASSLMQLENAMRTLTMNPGKFDSLVAHLVDTISPFLDQPNQCEEIFKLIIQQVCISNCRLTKVKCHKSH